MSLITVYGAEITIPEAPASDQIQGHELPIKEQFWVRHELPSIFDIVEFDKAGNPLLTPDQERYASEEVRRCKEGHWVMIKGVATYVTGLHYFYMQWWKLETDVYPDYRDVDRRFFLFLWHWQRVSWTLGCIIGKKRREGMTSKATAALIYECIFYKNSNCGFVSKTSDDAKAGFTGMIAFGYRQLPVFMKPQQLNNKDSVSELVFAHKSEEIKATKGRAFDNDTGHRSKVNYKAPGINAYDSGRMSLVLADEGGKWPKEAPFSKFVSIVKKTLVQGAKRVGWMIVPSTVNELTKSGGAEFKKVWKDADQFKHDRTPNRLVRYFAPAYDGFVGFIDKYGASVINPPDPETYQYLVDNFIGVGDLTEADIALGAKNYIYELRKNVEDLEEEIRMNPCDEEEMFMSANSECHFNAVKISAQRKRIETEPPRTRQVTFYRNLNDQSISWRDDPNGYWHILAFPPEKLRNNVVISDKARRPGNSVLYATGVDGYSQDQGGRKYGSVASGFIYLKLDIMDPENTGMFVAMFYGRPKGKDILHDQIMYACEYYGSPVWYEHTADDYKRYFAERGRLAYLPFYPKNALNPNKPEKELFRGFPISPFAMTKQLDTMIAYVEEYCDKIYFDKLLEQLLVFEADDRTKSDAVVAAMIALVSGLDTAAKPSAPKRPIVRTFENPRYNGKAV